MPIDLSAVGTETGPHPVTWNSRDAIIYALGVGAGCGRPLWRTRLHHRELGRDRAAGAADLRARGQRALGADACDRRFRPQQVGARRGNAGPASSRCHPTAPASATTASRRSTTKAAARWSCVRQPDGRGRAPARHRQDRPVHPRRRRLRRRSRPKLDWAAPERPADHVVEQQTRPDQALLYRLSATATRCIPTPPSPRAAASSGRYWTACAASASSGARGGAGRPRSGPLQVDEGPLLEAGLSGRNPAHRVLGRRRLAALPHLRGRSYGTRRRGGRVA